MILFPTEERKSMGDRAAARNGHEHKVNQANKAIKMSVSYY